MLIFLSLARESANERGDIRGKEWTRVAIDRRIGGRLHCLYILLSLPLASLFSRERESKQFNENKFPTLSCELEIEVFCCFNLSVSFHSRRFAVSPFRHFVIRHLPFSCRRLR